MGIDFGKKAEKLWKGHEEKVPGFIFSEEGITSVSFSFFLTRVGVFHWYPGKGGQWGVHQEGAYI